ncbi:MAG: HAMP domain-containing sensor histidine kinase [Gammaproteobacteria bacterium]|nr:HAMP domain-containing sensor histidine kinase [Gammaproteobacteria bacterium]
MLPNTVIKRFDQRRLRNLLLLIFVGLAVPTTILIWQAYSQLKWEAFAQHRSLAEQLTDRIDARLIDMINAADARTFADYSFLVVTGDPSANFLQRSPLSNYPVTADLPGVLGHFQVDTDGSFSTPLLPPPDSNANELGIGTAEYDERLQLAREIQAVLADNQLVRSRPEPELRRGMVASPAAPAAMSVGSEVSMAPEEKEAEDLAGYEGRSRELRVAADDDVADKRDLAPLERDFRDSAAYSQQVFDELTVPSKSSAVGMAGVASEAEPATGADRKDALRQNTMGKVSDLQLDAALQKKSEQMERAAVAEQARSGGRFDAPARAKRRELSALSTGDQYITTFESEIDPLEFSLLDSGHFVLFRKVWRDGERYIQGLLIDQARFTQDIISTRFMETALWGMSSLIVAYQDDVIQTMSRADTYRLSTGSAEMEGALLYRNRLSAPLDSLELIYSIKSLPPGPGASIIGWLTLVLALVFVGGFIALYRLGVGQINLARQQQDFVAAVNHELKTPLTSIRMYGEMLKEGWADEDKRQSYYEFIHDESERLTRLISNVLQLAKFSRNEPQLDMKPTPVSSLMSNIESKIASQVERAGFTLEFSRDATADEVAIRIDEDCFTQIIINLVDNAIKFSKDAATKRIEITSRLDTDQRVAFAVRDYGPGIPTDQMKKIFKLFYRSESELTRETVGTGIGLAIVHQLTLAMDGKVDVINREPGAEFVVSFATA